MKEEHRPSVFIETHGCKLNQADTQVLARQFAQAGYSLAEKASLADVYVLNTCTVTHVADRKARQALREARRGNPKAVIVATSCYAQRAPQEFSQIDGVDLILGNAQKDLVVRSVSQLLDIPEVPRSTGEDQPEAAVTSLRARAMVKIQEGCDQVCAYCVVPKVRGRERSVEPGVLVAHVGRLVAEGYQEVVLTGTQLGTYGSDLGVAPLAGLIREILRQTSAPRLRVSSLQAQELNSELLDLWADPRLCPHFHLPLQSGSAAVLKAMRRRYSPRQYTEAVEAIRRRVPHAAVTADVIVGFPGETEDQFQETYDLCRELRVAGLHVFPYSTRPGTTAAYLSPTVEEKVKRIRMEKMLALARELAHSYRRRLLGTTGSVLWENSYAKAGAQVWTGLTGDYVRVATFSDQALHNRITATILERQDSQVVWGKVA